MKGETVGTVYKETFTKPPLVGAEIIVRKGKRLGNADMPAAYTAKH